MDASLITISKPNWLNKEDGHDFKESHVCWGRLEEEIKVLLSVLAGNTGI